MTLTALEIVLGIDNIIFISILIKRMPEAQRARSRVLGLGLAILTGIRLLLSQAWVTNLTTPFFCVLPVRSPEGIVPALEEHLEIHGSLVGGEKRRRAGASSRFAAVLPVKLWKAIEEDGKQV